MDFASKKDIFALSNIWRTCFRDSQEYIDFYFTHCFNRVKILVERNTRGEPISMLSLFPTAIKLQNNLYSASYIYAVATLPEYRGKGITANLIHQSDAYCKSVGNTMTLLVPQSEGLIKYYKKLEFSVRTSLQNYTYLCTGKELYRLPLEPCSEKDFLRSRLSFQESMPCALLHDKPMLQYIYNECKLAGGHILTIQTNGKKSYAIIYKQKDAIFIKETSVNKEYLPSLLSSLCKHFQLGKAILRTHLKLTQNSNTFTHALIKPLEDIPLADKEIYVNLMLD